MTTIRSDSLFRIARWAVATTWGTNRALTATYIGLQAVQGVLPALQALATRGLIDSAVSQVRVHNESLRTVARGSRLSLLSPSPRESVASCRTSFRAGWRMT
jgi:hypothetical protein